jgi:hypothetical protein
MNSSLVFAALARWYVWPKMGESTASSAVWLKRVPRAMAEGLTAGRSGRLLACWGERVVCVLVVAVVAPLELVVGCPSLSSLTPLGLIFKMDWPALGLDDITQSVTSDILNK